jgi:DNA-binding GntR family transcriptional regulator
MVDYSRLTAQQIAMQTAKAQYEKEKQLQQDNQDQLRQRQQTQNGTGYRNLHDIVNSDFHKTTIQTLNNNRRKEFIQKHMNDTLDNLPDDQLQEFVDKF